MNMWDPLFPNKERQDGDTEHLNSCRSPEHSLMWSAKLCPVLCLALGRDLVGIVSHSFFHLVLGKLGDLSKPQLRIPHPCLYSGITMCLDFLESFLPPVPAHGVVF